jgi:hypothetical protein
MAADASQAPAELDKGVMLSHLKIDFTNGVSWEFDGAKKDKKSAQEVVRALGGTIR